MKKIQMTTPLVEMDGDEMTRVIWQMIKDELLSPYIDLNTEYYDLGLKHRDETDDQVTIDAAKANMKYAEKKAASVRKLYRTSVRPLAVFNRLVRTSLRPPPSGTLIFPPGVSVSSGDIVPVALYSCPLYTR